MMCCVERRVAKFLESRGEVLKAMEVARDPDYRFELAITLNNFEVAKNIAEQLASEARWKQLGEMALADGQLALAEQCLERSNDLSGQMLMFTATGNRAGMQVTNTSSAYSNAQHIFPLFSYGCSVHWYSEVACRGEIRRTPMHCPRYRHTSSRGVGGTIVKAAVSSTPLSGTANSTVALESDS